MNLYKFELADRSCSVSDIQDYFDYIIKKHNTVTDNSVIRTNVNKIENSIAFKIKTEYHLEFQRLKQLNSFKALKIR